MNARAPPSPPQCPSTWRALRPRCAVEVDRGRLALGMVMPSLAGRPARHAAEAVRRGRDGRLRGGDCPPVGHGLRHRLRAQAAVQSALTTLLPPCTAQGGPMHGARTTRCPRMSWRRAIRATDWSFSGTRAPPAAAACHRQAARAGCSRGTAVCPGGSASGSQGREPHRRRSRGHASRCAVRG